MVRHSSQPSRHVSVRGFSLIEMMLVISITAVLAAVSVSTMGPSVDTAKLEGNAEALASFLASAQSEAIASKRCVKVRFATGSSTELIGERLNSFDCEAPSTAPRIDASKALWVRFASFRVDNAVVTMAFDPAPSETSASALGGDEKDQLRFRPSGRLFSSDETLNDDDGVIKLTHTRMPTASAGRTKKVLVEGHGLICDVNRGTDPGGSGNNLFCP